MTKDKRVNARITAENHAKLDAYCKEKGITLSQWVTQRIELMRFKYNMKKEGDYFQRGE